MLIVFRQLSAYLELAYPKAHIYGGFPENIYLTEPFVGYVNQPLEFTLCDQFALNLQQEQLIVLHAYTPSQTHCRLLLDRVEVEPVQKFSQQAKWVELYQVTATQSALLDESDTETL